MKPRRPGAASLIRLYRLKPHPEGGYFRETYRASGKTVTARGARNFSTAVLFLLKKGQTSRLHRIASDEVWHFYSGGPLKVSAVHPDGSTSSAILGPDPSAGHKTQHVVPAGCWFGAAPEPKTAYSLVGCTVAPGFDFRDFELGDRGELIEKFPRAARTIRRFTEQRIK